MVDSLERLREMMEELSKGQDPAYELEGVLLDFTEQVVGKMIATGTKRSELAERLGTSRAYVTKLLDGQENMTLKTVVRVATALDLKVDLKLRPRVSAPKAKRKPAAKKPAPKTSAKKPSAKKRAAAARSR